MMKNMMRYLVFAASLLGLVGCGGGGGGGKTAVEKPLTSAVLKLSIQGTLPQGTTLAGVGVSVTLPQGMSVKTDANGAVSSDVVTPSGTTTGKASVVPPDYTPATATAPGKLSFVIASEETTGFGAGEFATLNLVKTGDATITPTDFTIADFKPVDLTGRVVPGLSVTFVADIQ